MRVPGGGPVRRSGSPSGRWTSSRSATSTRACSTTPPAGPTSRCSGWTASATRRPRSPLAELEAQAAKGEDALSAFLKERTGRTPNAISKALAANARCAARSSGCGRPATTTSALRAGAALRRAGPRRLLRLSGRHPAGQRLRHGGDRPPLHRHALHAAQPDRADRPAHAGAAGLRRPSRGEAAGASGGCDRPGTARPQDLRHGDGVGRVPGAGGRYLSERLLEAWEDAEAAYRAQGYDRPCDHAGGDALGARPRTDTVLPTDEPRSAASWRCGIVGDRCLYGVDKNPMAVEMAKLSLWLTTLAKDRPFTFLDHALRCGDSLLGIDDVEQLQYWSLDARGGWLQRCLVDRASHRAARWPMRCACGARSRRTRS